jgi:membrane-associated phospholipid phosphatase
MIRFLPLLLLLLASCSSGNSQTDSASGAGSIILRDIATSVNDARSVFSSPFRISDHSLLTTGAVAGSTLLLFCVDKPVREMFLRNRSTLGDRLADFGTQYGNARYGVGVAGGLYLGGLIANNEELRETGAMLLESVVFAGLTTTVLKVVAGRSRPYLGEGNARFLPFRTDDDHLSFPTGHATVAFAVSSLLAERLENTYASIGLYSAAAVTGLSRMYNDEHWLSDVFLGAAIGTTSGLAVARLHKRSEPDTGGLYLMPAPAGLVAGYRF